MAKGKNYKLFDIRVVDVFNKETKETEKKGRVQFPKNVDVYVDGEKVDLGEYRSVFLKKAAEVVAGLDRAVSDFGLNPEYAEKEKKFIEDKNISSVCELYKK